MRYIITLVLFLSMGGTAHAFSLRNVLGTGSGLIKTYPISCCCLATVASWSIYCKIMDYRSSPARIQKRHEPMLNFASLSRLRRDAQQYDTFFHLLQEQATDLYTYKESLVNDLALLQWCSPRLKNEALWKTVNQQLEDLLAFTENARDYQEQTAIAVSFLNIKNEYTPLLQALDQKQTDEQQRIVKGKLIQPFLEYPLTTFLANLAVLEHMLKQYINRYPSLDSGIAPDTSLVPAMTALANAFESLSNLIISMPEYREEGYRWEIAQLKEEQARLRREVSDMRWQQLLNTTYRRY